MLMPWQCREMLLAMIALYIDAFLRPEAAGANDPGVRKYVWHHIFGIMYRL